MRATLETLLMLSLCGTGMSLANNESQNKGAASSPVTYICLSVAFAVALLAWAFVK